MEMKYEVHRIKNVQGTGKSRVYIQLRNRKAQSTEGLLREIEASCTLKASDVMAVMAEIREIAIRELSQGKSLHLPGIGFLSLAVGNTPPDKKANGKITGKDIFVRKIRFRAEKKLLAEVKDNVSFTKSNYTTLSAEYTEVALCGNLFVYFSILSYINKQAMRTEFGLSEYKAKQWLTLFVANGQLKKISKCRHSLYYL